MNEIGIMDQPMLGKIIFAISATMCSVVPTSAQELSKQAILDKEQSFYAFNKDQIKQEYEAQIASATEHLKQTGKLNNMSKKELDESFDYIKNDFYNKAVMQTTCIGETLRSLPNYDPRSQTSTEAFLERSQTCVEAKGVEFSKSITLLLDYEDYIKSLPPGTTVRCEIEARLFERELQLPPYDFLKTKHNALHDYQKYNNCLTEVITHRRVP
jgi:hypothetical protein